MTEDEKLDEMLDHGFEPKPWMKLTDRTLDAYKGEVETMRVRMRRFEVIFQAALKDIAEIKKLQIKASKYLGELKETEAKE